MIRNTTRDTVLATKERWALTSADRMRGLLGRPELGAGEALVISPCNSIHMFFMRFAIDVVFVSGEGRVIRMIRGLRPWRFTRLHFGVRHTMELPVGAIERSGTRVGDLLTWDPPVVGQNGVREESSALGETD